MTSLSISSLSVVVPLHNEAAVIDDTIYELLSILPQICNCWQIIAIDDGSNDGTLGRLQSMARNKPIRVVPLSRRRGQSAALWTGFATASGEVIITMDGDGQNDPADFAKLLVLLEDCDLVVGNRRHRRDTLRKRLFSRFGNVVRNILTNSQLPDSGCGLKVFRRSVLSLLLPVDGFHRFIPILVEISGGRVLSADVNHRHRAAGQSKYGIIDRLLEPFIDCLALAWLKRRRLPSDLLGPLVTSSESRTASLRRIDQINISTFDRTWPNFEGNCTTKTFTSCSATLAEEREPQS